MSEPTDPKLAEVLAELAEVKAERDLYLRALYAMNRDPVLITEEELAGAETNGSSFEEILAEIERPREVPGRQEAGQ